MEANNIRGRKNSFR